MSSATPENRQIGNYRLLEWLGGGYFADVYLAEHIYLDRQVAVKVLRTHLTNQEYIDLFRQEARTIAKLEHPNIVQVTDFDIVNGTPFLVMRCAPSSLRKLHPKGIRLPLTKIVTYVTQIASTLQYAHDAGIVHRDVKPENMLLGQNNEALLSDFGIATVTDSYRHSQQDAAGTLVYMAPEQIQGFPRRASDQYSLGIVIYEWLCGKPPFTEGNFIQLSYQHIHVPPPPLREKVPAIPPLVEEVVLKALEKEPDKRFPSVTAFAKALEEAWALPGEHHYPIEVADAMRECYYKWLGKADWGEMKEVGLDDAKELQHNYRVGGETKVTKGYKRPFTRGAIYWSDRVGAQPIWGGNKPRHASFTDPCSETDR
jgi:eukaryotic-like serine/threonine-protein kinase